MHELVVLVHLPVMHEGGLLRIVEEQQVSAAGANLGVGRYSVAVHHLRAPGGNALHLQGAGVQVVGLTALVEGSERLACVDDDIGGRGVLESAARAPARAGGERRPVNQAGVEGLTSGLLLLKPPRADEAVAVFAATVLKTQQVHHAVAVEGVVGTQRLMYGVLRVAQVDPIETPRNLADHLEPAGVDFLPVGGERPAHEGVIARLQGVQGFVHKVDVHDAAWLVCVVGFG